MSQFTIEMLADQYGVSMTVLRTWQRYGMLTPARNSAGKCYFDASHLQRIELILRWLNRGVPPAEIARHLKGQHAILSSQWEQHQQVMLSALERKQREKLRALLHRLGREIPAALLIDNIFSPLRQWLQKNADVRYITLRIRFDTQLLEYITFVMQKLHKRATARLVMIALNADDPLSIWLEALRLSGEGLRIEVLGQPLALPDLSLFHCEHYLLWSDRPLSPQQRMLIQQWRNEGIPFFTAGPGFQENSRSTVIPPQ